MLTDEELIKVFQSDEADDGTDESGIRIARAVIAAYEAKLREQEPVAWMQISVEAGVTTRFPRDHMPKKFNADWWRFEPLYKHPAPIPEGYALVPIDPEGQWSNDDLINIMVDAYQDSNGGYYDSMLAAYKAMLAATRSKG